MSKENVQEIFSHVDMSKIDLTSFKISEKKFNELSHLYRNRVVLSCFAIVRRSESPHDEYNVAFDMLKKVVENPDLYTYAHIYSMERQAVDKAINDITSRRDRNINDVKVKAIEKRMKDAYKQMRKTLELALENDDFEQEFDEELVTKCLNISQNIVDAIMRREAESANGSTNAVAEKKNVEVNVTEMAVNQEQETVCETPKNDVSNQMSNEATTSAKVVMKSKVLFWKRLFGKMMA